MNRSRAIAVALLAAASLAGCTRLPGGSPEPTVMTTSPTSASASPSPSLTTDGVPSPSSGTSPSPASASTPAEAALDLLASRSANLALEIRYERRPGDPVETLVAADGRVEPAAGRGSMRYDLTGLFEVPGETPVPDATSIVDLVWTPDEVFLLIGPGSDGDWQARTRADARLASGLIGRLPDEVLGLVELIAAADPDRTAAAAGDTLDGQPADRWLVRVPVEQAALAGVPAGTPDAAVIREAYGVAALEVEVWLVDGALRRLRYELARAEAPYGGPDRTITTYDWSVEPSPEPIVLPDVRAPTDG